MQSSLVTPKALGKIGASLSPSKLPNILAGLIIFLASTQLGLHFWPLSSLVYGVRIDYLSPTIYLFDLLLLSYLIARRSVLKRNSWLQAKKGSAAAERTDLVGIVVPILLVNLLYSANPLATLSWSLHFILYFVFLRTVLKRNSWQQAKKGSAAAERTVLYGILRFGLTLSLLFQTILSLTQVVLGHSVGGLLYYLGERTVSVGSPGIALGSFMGEVVLRAYGTFGHPNVLAGWSVIVLLILLRLKSNIYLLTSATALTTMVIMLSQSRAAALALFCLVIPFYLLKNLKQRIIYFSIFFCSLFYVLPILTPPRSGLSLSERRDLQGVSLKVISRYPIFGTGAQASISTYPALPLPKPRGGGGLQPDHNSFTLFLSWFGLFGVLAILCSLRSFNIRHSLFSILPLLPILLLDHYLLTSPQGLFILMIYAAIALNYSHAQIDRQ